MFFQNPLTAFARNYVAVKRPADKVSINPNIVTMGGIDTADKDNVIASQGLISRPLDNGLLVSSRYDSSKDSENWTYYNPAVFEPSILGRLPDYSIAMSPMLRLCRCGSELRGGPGGHEVGSQRQAVRGLCGGWNPAARWADHPRPDGKAAECAVRQCFEVSTPQLERAGCAL